MFLLKVTLFFWQCDANERRREFKHARKSLKTFFLSLFVLYIPYIHFDEILFSFSISLEIFYETLFNFCEDEKQFFFSFFLWLTFLIFFSSFTFISHRFQVISNIFFHIFIPRFYFQCIQMKAIIIFSSIFIILNILLILFSTYNHFFHNFFFSLIFSSLFFFTNSSYNKKLLSLVL